MLTKTSFTIRLHPNDDVVIARAQLVSGTTLLDENVKISGLVPPGHKVATRAIAPGEPVKRYNQIIGFAKRAIAPGEHVHLHNLAMGEFTRDYAFGADVKPTRYAAQPATFMGIVRPDGRVATRNYIGILSTVNCSATVAHGIADAFKGAALQKFPNVDGVVALTHGSGCGMDVQGESMQVLRRTLGGYAKHANFAGALIVGLGCEANQISALLGAEALHEGPLLRTFSIQDTGGTAKAIARGVAMIDEMLPHANDLAISLSAFSAAGPTAIRASRPILRSARQSISWCATAARRYCPRLRRSTARSTFSPAVRCRAKSAKSSSSGSSGGRNTPRETAAR